MSTLTDKLPTIDLDEAKKPLFAAVGVVDLYVEQAKELPAGAKKLQAKVTEAAKAKAEALRAARAEKLKALPANVSESVKAFPAKASESVKSLPAKTTELRTEVQDRVAKAQTSATEYYGTLAARGEKLVAQIRKQETSSAALAEGKAAVKKAEATTKKTATKPAVKAEAAAPVTPAESVEQTG